MSTGSHPIISATSSGSSAHLFLPVTFRHHPPPPRRRRFPEAAPRMVDALVYLALMLAMTVWWLVTTAPLLPV